MDYKSDVNCVKIGPTVPLLRCHNQCNQSSCIVGWIIIQVYNGWEVEILLHKQL